MMPEVAAQAMSHHPFYQVVPFPYTGHRALEVVDRPGEDLHARLVRGTSVAVDGSVVDVAVITEGRGMDVLVTPAGVVVVTTAGADVLRRHAGADVQFIAARLAGSTSDFFIANVIKVVASRDAARFLEARPVSGKGPLIPPESAGAAQIFRLKFSPKTVLVTCALKDAIVAAGLIGPGLISLDRAYHQVRPGEAPP